MVPPTVSGLTKLKLLRRSGDEGCKLKLWGDVSRAMPPSHHVGDGRSAYASDTGLGSGDELLQFFGREVLEDHRLLLLLP
jgi:hypothetical protein